MAKKQKQTTVSGVTYLRQRLTRKLGLNSIQGRLSAIAFLFIVGTVVTITIVSYRFTFEFERQRFHDHFGLLATYMANNAELGVLIGNEEILSRLTNSMLQIEDVHSVTIRGHGNKALIRKSKKEDLSVSDRGVVSAPVMSHVIADAELFQQQHGLGKQLGEVEIIYSLSGLFELQKTLAKRYILISLFLSLAPVLMYWMLSRAINAPLKQLVKLARQVSRGNLDVRASGGTLQETRTLALAINEMLESLAVKRHEIQQANAAMARQQVLAEVGKFSMIMAHEIKNPLAVIKGSMDILTKNEKVNPKLKDRMAEYIYDEVQRMNKLVEDFLAFSRPIEPNFKLNRVDDFVGKILQKVTLVDKSIHVENQIQSTCKEQTLESDIVQFERALLNVVRNAIEASAGGDEVNVLAFCTDTYLNFQVSDGGTGFDPDKAAAMFEPFVSTKSKGTGLGLALVKDVIKIHKGMVSIKNLPKGGACFTLRLPLADVG